MKVLHSFWLIHRQFGLAKLLFKGLQKHTADLLMLFALSNLWMARKPLMRLMGVVRRKMA